MLLEMNSSRLRCKDFDQPVAESEPDGRIGLFSQCLFHEFSNKRRVPSRFLLGIDHAHDGAKFGMAGQRLLQFLVDQFVVDPEGESIGHWIFRQALRNSR